MSWQIQIVSAKPNPSGKDSTYGSAREDHLLGEWVDLKNVGNESVRLSVLDLCNREFSNTCTILKRHAIYWHGSEQQVLFPNQTVRVHTGKETMSFLMSYNDRQGADLHAYANRSWFVMNNRCGDAISVWWKTRDGEWRKEDEAAYAPNVPDGALLVRSGNMLVPQMQQALGGFR